MRKLATLLLAAGLVFGAATGASAIDFKAKGQWIMSFDLGNGANFTNKDRAGNRMYGWGANRGTNPSADNFNAQQRVRLALEAVASEFLSGTVQFEIGNQIWGRNNQGGALGADGMVVEVKHAYIDWMVPNTDLKVRMGIQPIALPSFTTGNSMILDDDAAAIALDYKFNDNVRLTALWARPYNDNYGANTVNGAATQTRTQGIGGRQPAGYNDNADFFALLLPLSFDGVKVTPWAMLGFVGPNTLGNADNFWGNNGNTGNATTRVATGMLPAAWTRPNNATGGNDWVNQYNTSFWFGLTGEVTAWDPFRLAWDFNIGTSDGFGKSYLSRGGWYLALLAEYKLDWGTPGLYAWYSSGDDSNPKNGSERMPTISANGNNDFSNFAGNGNPYIAREGMIGSTLVGTWGIGARLKDVSFLEGLKHTLRINYFQGTNSPGMARYIRNFTAPQDWRVTRRNVGTTDFNSNADYLYLTSNDSALELGLTTTYKIYENLTLMVDMGYIALWLDKSNKVWGRGTGYAGVNQGRFSGTDAWNVNASFVYQF